MKILKAAVPEAMSGAPVLGFVRRHFALAAGTVRHLKFVPGAIRVNGESVRGDRLLEAGELVEVLLPEKESAFAAADCVMPEILYEDEDLLILNKPAGVAVHGRSERGDLTVGAMMSAYLGSETAFHPVNRLDKETSGAMVIAKNALTHDRLRRLRHTSAFERAYLAVAEGELPEAGLILAPLARESEGAYRRAFADTSSPCHAQMALTRFICPFKAGERSFAGILPQTGRTHQIRAHFAFLGHPLVGDRLYGTPSAEIARTALHSASVRLVIPPDSVWPEGKEIAVTAPLPADMKALLPELPEALPKEALSALSLFKEFS